MNIYDNMENTKNNYNNDRKKNQLKFRWCTLCRVYPPPPQCHKPFNGSTLKIQVSCAIRFWLYCRCEIRRVLAVIQQLFKRNCCVLLLLFSSFTVNRIMNVATLRISQLPNGWTTIQNKNVARTCIPECFNFSRWVFHHSALMTIWFITI